MDELYDIGVMSDKETEEVEANVEKQVLDDDLDNDDDVDMVNHLYMILNWMIQIVSWMRRNINGIKMFKSTRYVFIWF